MVKRYEPQELEIISKSKPIGSGKFASVHAARWMETSTTYAIKQFHNSSKDDIINEVYLTGMVAGHPNIITICGITKFKGEINYSLVLEYADSGTLREFLREKDPFEWDDKLKFAKEMASAILYLHKNQIIHGDLHPGNILIHQRTPKIADFGRSRIHGSAINKKENAYGVMPYMDPKILNDNSYDLTKKSDIYSLAVLFWQLTSCRPPFESETDPGLDIRIINGKREIPVPNTNDEYVKLYQRCWEFEPNDRPNISEIVSILDNISSEKNDTKANSKEDKITEPENDNFSCQI